ncbi:MAG: hypothetical protein ACE5HO_08125 [bacterium]
MAKSMQPKKARITSFPRDTLEQAKIVKQGWNSVGGKLLVPNISMETFLQKLAEAQSYVDRAEQLKLERAKAIHERNMCLSELWDLTKRIRNAAKATFGDYSAELELLNTPKDVEEQNDLNMQEKLDS